MAKFRPGEPVWCLSDGAYEGPEGRFKGTIIRLKRRGFNNRTGEEVEEYVVEIPALRDSHGCQWTVTSDYLRPRVEDVADPPGLSDADPGRGTTWDRCEWQPGSSYGKGKVYVPD